MSSLTWLLASIFLILINLLAFATAQPFCINDGNYTSNSTYRTNLNTLLSNLSTNVDSNGFYNASVGQSVDRVYATVLCRGDLQLDECRTCIQNATFDLLQECPNQKKAIQWSGTCMLRYSNESMFGIQQTRPAYFWWNPKNSTSPDQFYQDLRTLLDNLRDRAASGGSLRKVAAANRTTSDFQTIFALEQCTPDLSLDDCDSCLRSAASDIPSSCDSKVGCRILGPSCNLRFEIYSFYNETRLQELQLAGQEPPVPSIPSPSLPPPPPAGKKDDNSARTIIIIVASIAACIILIICVCILLRKRIKQKPHQLLETEDEITTAESVQYDFGRIRTATNDFSDSNKLGQGGFGAVYRGKLPNGQEIAVKRLSTDSGQGDAEFKNEVLLVARLQHRNLVRLLGFSMEGNERLLVYEFVENASLDQFIFDPIKRSKLDWEKRYKIIGGIAKGLLYLHEESRIRIIHRDLKAGNVLLDGAMNPKIADFGMARLFVSDETQGNTSRIVGTYGYMSPEYAMHGQFSVKSDVFSFGVLVLEIISGQKNNSFRNGENIEDLLSSAWKFWGQGTAANMIDPVLTTGSANLRDMLRCIHMGLLCVQENPADRPTMAKVILMLSSFSLTLPVPSEPAFFVPSGHGLDKSVVREFDSADFESSKSHSQVKSDHSTHSSKNDVSITELYPR